MKTGRQSMTVLVLSPLEGDHSSFQAIIGHSNWVVFHAYDLVSAVTILQRQEIAVLLCERDLVPGTWIDALEYTKSMPNAPSVIITARSADERLWVEALNFGAWDVLSKLFDRTEVIRGVESAWQHWQDQMQTRGTLAKTPAAGSPQ
jgi:DNA-binding NtrC family response regulator